MHLATNKQLWRLNEKGMLALRDEPGEPIATEVAAEAVGKLKPVVVDDTARVGDIVRVGGEELEVRVVRTGGLADGSIDAHGDA